MKRFLPILAMMLLGCAGSTNSQRPAPLPKTAVLEAPQRVPEPTRITHESWSIELPAGWKYNDAPQVDGDSTRLLEAKSLKKVGRSPITLAIDSSGFNGPDFFFGEAAAVLIQRVAEDNGERVLNQRRVTLNGHPATLTIMVSQRAIVTGVIALGVNGTGYLVSCGGDALGEYGKIVSQTCTQVMSTFKAK